MTTTRKQKGKVVNETKDYVLIYFNKFVILDFFSLSLSYRWHTYVLIEDICVTTWTFRLNVSIYFFRNV